LGSKDVEDIRKLKIKMLIGEMCIYFVFMLYNYITMHYENI